MQQHKVAHYITAQYNTPHHKMTQNNVYQYKTTQKIQLITTYNNTQQYNSSHNDIKKENNT